LLVFCCTSGHPLWGWPWIESPVAIVNSSVLSASYDL
jgi:hypothetical protein